MVIVKTKDKEYEVKEVKYKDLIGGDDLSKADSGTHAKRLMELSAGVTSEEYDNLSMKDGIALQKVINDINGLEDFQKPLKE